MKSSLRIAVVSVGVITAFCRFSYAQYDAPANYYSNTATLQGAALKTRLQTIISTGVVSFNYGDARNVLGDLWRDPNNSANMILYYTGASVSGAWDLGVTWNREHVWPASKLGVDVQNSTTGRAADLFELAPANPSVNSTRSNRNYGDYAATGANGVKSTYYFPGDAWKGDAARSIFYMATRYSNGSATASATNLIPLNGDPSATYNVGDLRSLVKWNYADPVSVFEQRKNQVNYTTYQKNRNPFIDHPEWVHSVFVNNANDTELSFGTPDAGGASAVNLDLGRVLINAAVPADQSVTLSKAGVDGTYYAVTTGGLARSDVAGRLNAFAVDVSGSRALSVGLNTTTTTPGMRAGTVTVDNLDITTAGGAGHGANDGDDVVNVSLSVLAASNSSFAVASDVNSLTIDFGTVERNAAVGTQSVSIANLASSFGGGLTAGLDLDAITRSGDWARVTDNLAAFTNLAAGLANTFTLGLDTSALGSYSAVFTLQLSDEDLPGTVTQSSLQLNVIGQVVMSLLLGDYNGDGVVDAADYTVWADHFGQTGNGVLGDGNGDGVVDAADYTVWADHFGQGTPGGVTGAVPEPGILILAGLPLMTFRRRR